MKYATLTLPRLGIAVLVIGGMITLPAFRSGSSHFAAATMQSPGNRCGLRGTYGFTGVGNIFEGNVFGFPAGIFSTNGTITVDADGRYTIHQVEVLNGQVVNASDTFQGTLTVDPECSFTGTIDSLPGTTALVGAAVDNGKEARALLAVPGVQINFLTVAKVHPGSSTE